METGNRNLTQELGEVLSYMEDKLINEFPTDLLTPEYLILSILDTRNNHANLILNNFLMSNNLEELRRAYVSVIEEHMRPQLMGNQRKYSDELNRLLDLSDAEASKMGDESTGTQHVLLAILNKANGFKARGVFERFRLEYDFIFQKCGNQKDESPKPFGLRLKRSSSNSFNPSDNIPLKSQVNAKAISNRSSGVGNKFIGEYTISLSNMAKEGELDEVIGRKAEINEIMKTLSRRKKNNAILVGNNGVGKTTIVRGLALMIESGNVPSSMEGKEIVILNQMALLSGTHFRGMFEERVDGLFKELQSSDRYILFIDDIQTVLKSGSREKDGDLSEMIGDILTSGKVKVVATATFKGYRNSIESNPMLASKFQKIVVEPNSRKEAEEIIERNKKYYEEFHNVEYTDKAISKSVELAERYVTDRCLPDSAFDIIDMAGASKNLSMKEPPEILDIREEIKNLEEERFNALNHGNFEIVDELNSRENELSARIAEYKRKVRNEKSVLTVTEEDIASVVSEMTNIPISKLSSSERQKIAHIDEILKEHVVGQDEAIDAICKTLKRNKVGLGDANKPMCVYMLLGPSGVGKTLIAKKLAEEIFGDEKSLVRIDMSEYSEKNSVAKLTGAAPGYIGFDNGGQLTEAIKHKQHCVLLLDEIEKADQEVYNVFLQLFDEGRLTDSAGQVVNFKNVIILMTSNVGARKAAEMGAGIGFSRNEEENKRSVIEKELKKRFSPEFLNRIDKIVYFNSLTDDNLKNIVKLEINKFNKRLNNIEYNIVYDNEVVSYVYEKARKEKEFGARPIIRIVQNDIEDKVTELMLTNDYPEHYEFSATCVNNEIRVS